MSVDNLPAEAAVPLESVPTCSLVDVNQRTSWGYTSLFLAVQSNNLTVVDMLLKAGGDPNLPDTKGNVPLVVTRDAAMAQLLLDYGANVALKDTRRGTLLHRLVLSIPSARLRRLRSFAEQWPGDRAQEVDGNPGLVEHAEVLLKYGIDVNAKDQRGATALHLAVIRDVYSIVQFLVTRGASSSISNNDHENALTTSISRTERRPHIAKFLLSAMREAQPDSKQDILDCYETLAKRAKYAYDQTLRFPDPVEWSMSRVYVTSTIMARADDARPDFRPEPIRVLEITVGDCLALEKLVRNIIDQPVTIGGKNARELNASIQYSKRKVICQVRQHSYGGHGLRCYSCLQEVAFEVQEPFDICAKCVKEGNWCRNVTHQMQKFTIGELLLDEPAPWVEFDWAAQRSRYKLDIAAFAVVEGLKDSHNLDCAASDTSAGASEKEDQGEDQTRETEGVQENQKDHWNDELRLA